MEKCRKLRIFVKAFWMSTFWNLFLKSVLFHKSDKSICTHPELFLFYMKWRGIIIKTKTNLCWSKYFQSRFKFFFRWFFLKHGKCDPLSDNRYLIQVLRFLSKALILSNTVCIYWIILWISIFKSHKCIFISTRKAKSQFVH